MSYNRHGIPRAYVDLINFNLATGWSDQSHLTVKKVSDDSDVSFASGSKADMFDLKPANYATIDKTNQEFYIQYNTRFSFDAFAESSFIAILGHNFQKADIQFKVEMSDNSDMTSATIITTSGSYNNIINAASDAEAGYINPSENGWCLLTWATQESNNQYLRITIEKDSGTGDLTDDVKIGAILYGEYVDFPKAPARSSVQTINIKDGIVRNQAVGGRIYATTPALGQPMWAATPPWMNHFSEIEDYVFERRHGRLLRSMKFLRIDDTDMFSSNQHSGTLSDWYNSESLDAKFFNRLAGNNFLVCINEDSSNEGDYCLYQLDEDTVKTTLSGHRKWDLELNLIENW